MASRRRARIPAGATATDRRATNCLAANQYNPQLVKAGLQTFPRPSPAQLTTLTQQVATNNRFSYTESADDGAVMAAVRQGVSTYLHHQGKPDLRPDSGDLAIGNGDPDLAVFGKAVTPNQHNLARNSSPSTTSSTRPRSAMTAGSGPLRRRPPTWSNAMAGGLRVPRPQLGIRGSKSQCERCQFRPSPRARPPIPSRRTIPSVAGSDRRGCAGWTEQ